LCTGKVYYDLIASPLRAEAKDLAIIRLELLEPFRTDDVLALIAKYSNVHQLIWVQEEPMNMGAYWHIKRRLEPRLPSSSPLGMLVAPNGPAPARAMPSPTKRRRSASCRPCWPASPTWPAPQLRDKIYVGAALTRLDEPV